MNLQLESMLCHIFCSYSQIEADHVRVTQEGYIGSIEDFILMRIRNLNSWRRRIGRPEFPEEESLELIRVWKVKERSNVTS